jgi:hypothetical protein
MPWSPIPKFPDIVRDLAGQGYTIETALEPLRTAVMRQTGLIRDQSVRQAIRAMEQLGYLKMSENGITWKIFRGTLGNFGERKQRAGKEAAKEADEFLEKFGGGKRGRHKKR